jgi:hypothetical protein
MPAPWKGKVMSEAGPDIAELFAPLAPAQAFRVVLTEAHDVLKHVREPIDAELWGSDMMGALSRSSSGSAPGDASGDAATREMTGALVPAAEEAATQESLALLRIFAAIGPPGLRAAASQAADRVAALGVPEQAWAAEIGMPKVAGCWHFGDDGGRQESVTMTFRYGARQHAVSVLIDHGRGGKIKDIWVSDAAGLLDKTFMAAQADPRVLFEELAPATAHARLERAISAGEAPEQADQRDAIVAHRALLYARMSLLAVESAITPDEGGTEGGEPPASQ